jgi:hypothetical protein
MQAECVPDKEEIPELCSGRNPYSGWFMPKEKPQFLEDGIWNQKYVYRCRWGKAALGTKRDPHEPAPG